jgi:integrating conjugative element protein (TIGR03761 family)
MATGNKKITTANETETVGIELAQPRKRTLRTDFGRGSGKGSSSGSVSSSVGQKLAAPPSELFVGFEDYDFEAEKVAVARLIDAAETDPLDPDYARFEIYTDNVRVLEERKALHREREQANQEVPISEARKARQIGALRTQEEDVMTLHTMEAMRLYLGVAPEPGAATKFGVPGARRAATALRQLFLLSQMDNPYADWMLQTDERVAEIKDFIDKTSKKHLKQLDDMKAKGLSYGLLAANDPQTVSLGYHSPYGYMMSTVIVLYDHCVRVLKSSERRDLLTKRDVHEQLFKIKHLIRAMFEVTLKGQRGLQRSDFVPQGADEAQLKRIAAAREIFGAVPQDIFAGARSPRHSLRNERIGAKDVRLLEAMALAQSDALAAAATSSSVGHNAGNLID